MCGGSLQLVQCSRIGHFYRVSTYSFEGNQYEILRRNDKRLMEVWMDDVKDLLYAKDPGKTYNYIATDQTAGSLFVFISV